MFDFHVDTDNLKFMKRAFRKIGVGVEIEGVHRECWYEETLAYHFML